MGGVSVYRQYQTNQFATNPASQIGTVLAADKYARKDETAILNGQPVAGFAIANSPTVAELTTGGFLTAGFSDAGQNGGPIKVAVRLEPTGCTGAKCQMAVSAYPTGSIMDKSGQPDALMASKSASALPNGSGWTNLASDVTKLAKNSYIMPNPLGAVPALVVAQEWIGSNQSSKTVPPVSYETKTEDNCTYCGSTTNQRSVTTDKWGAVTYGSWVYLTDSCAPPPPLVIPSCTNGASNYPTCIFTQPQPADCPEPPHLYCKFIRGYPDGTNQLTWGSVTYSAYPACTKQVNTEGAERGISCPEPYDSEGWSKP